MENIDEKRKELKKEESKLRAQERRIRKREVRLFQREERLKGSETLLNWFSFGLAYLSISQTGCQELLNPRTKNSKDKYLILPIIYNVKHALEIIVKFLTRLVSKNEDYDRDHHHNLKKLIEEFMNTIRKKVSDNNDRKRISNSLDYFCFITNKYYTLDMMRTAILSGRSTSFEDPNNTLFKYPADSEIKLHISYWQIADQANDDMIRHISSDIDETGKILLKLEKLLSKYKISDK